MNRPALTLGICLLLVAACGESEEAPTEALAPALGGLSGVEIPDGDELFVYDIEILRRAGLEDPGEVVPRLVRALVAPSTWENPRRIEIREGRLLAVHEAAVLEEVGRLLEAPRERADRGIELDLEVLGSRAASPDAPSLLAARERGETRTLGRLAFQLANGRWGRVEAKRERTYVAGLERPEGKPQVELRMSPLVDGVAADAAVWLEPRDRAVLHLLLTLRTAAGDSRSIDVPGAGEVPGYPLELPRRLTVQFRGQAALSPERWEIVATGPSPVPAETLHLIARARWRTSPEGTVEGVGTREGIIVASYPLAFPPPPGSRHDRGVPLHEKAARARPGGEVAGDRVQDAGEGDRALEKVGESRCPVRRCSVRYPRGDQKRSRGGRCPGASRAPLRHRPRHPARALLGGWLDASIRLPRRGFREKEMDRAGRLENEP